MKKFSNLACLEISHINFLLKALPHTQEEGSHRKAFLGPPSPFHLLLLHHSSFNPSSHISPGITVLHYS